MRKGQISIDLLLTAVVAIIVIAAIGGLVTNFRTAQEKISAQTQLEEITQKTASFITAAQALEGIKFNITYQVGKINYADENGNNKTVYPKMSINADKNVLVAAIQLPSPQGKETINSKSAIYYNTAKTIVNTTETETNGKIVIEYG